MRKAFRIAAASMVLSGAIITVPVAAQANFTASTAAALPVTTATLTVPASAITGSCVLRNGHNMITVAVDLTATNPRSTSHPLRVFSPDGILRYDGDAAALPQGTFRLPGNENSLAGTWTYQIHDEYRPAGSSVAWIGKTLTGTYVC